jgi:hypothetical protein
MSRLHVPNVVSFSNIQGLAGGSLSLESGLPIVV